jgi:general secretion pathway protein F
MATAARIARYTCRMPAYEFLALDDSGRRERGVLQADSARAARTQLRERGLSPLDVDEVDAERVGASGRSSGRLSGVQLSLLTRQLATLVRAGLPLDEALSALAEASEGRAQATVLALRARVMEGAALAEAMAGFPRAFPPAFRASVAAGEHSGRLDTVLLRLADWAESRDALRRQLIGALAYPVLLLIVALAVVAGLMAHVVPQVVGVFVQSGQTLPLPTRILLELSDVLRAGGLLWLLAVVALVGLPLLAWRQPQMRARLQGLLLRLPLLGRLLRAADTARFARTLALLGGAAVPLLEALRVATGVLQQAPLRKAMEQAARDVREGQGFARALQISGQFPPVPLRLIASGEKAGRLPEMLDEAAAQCERELQMALGLLGAALGPVVILGLGMLVLFIVLAVLLPIFELNTLIR